VLARKMVSVPLTGAKWYPGTRPHKITRVATSRTGNRESSSIAVRFATCMVPQPRLINASVISLSLIVYRMVQQIAAVELHADKQQLVEGRGK
jgi:hypothetical protein